MPRSQERVSDFIFEKDKLFACLNLNDQELETYNRYYNSFREQVPTPDLVIYLQASTEVLKKAPQEKERAQRESHQRRLPGRSRKAYEHFFFHYTSSTCSSSIRRRSISSIATKTCRNFSARSRSRSKARNISWPWAARKPPAPSGHSAYIVITGGHGELKVRKFGNSLGVVLPEEVIHRLRTDDGETAVSDRGLRRAATGSPLTIRHSRRK